jgi:PilZ domain
MPQPTPLPSSKLRTLIKLVDQDTPHLGITSDVSQSGLSCIVAAELTATAQPLLVSFRLSPLSKPISAQARVSWQRPFKNGQHTVRLNFTSISQPDQQQIKDYIAADWIKRQTGLH